VIPGGLPPGLLPVGLVLAAAVVAAWRRSRSADAARPRRGRALLVVTALVAGTVLLGEVLRAFGLDAFEVSERDILWGVAIDAAR